MSAASVDIVYLSCCEKWWDWERNGFVSRPAQIARAFAEHPGVGRLLVVDTPSSLARLAVPAENAPARTGLCSVSDAVYVLDQTRLMPKERSWNLSYRLNGRLHEPALVRAISHSAEQIGMSDPVIWLSGPLVARTAAAFPTSVIAYDAMDEWLALPEMRGMRREITDSYDRIRSRADLVFAVSAGLVERFSGARPQAHLVPNAVDSLRFAAAGPVPGDLLALPEPRVGYVGMLQDRIDVELVVQVARRLAHVSFVFLGPVLDEGHFERLRQCDNVHLLGARPASVVPDYLAAFDACVLPHLNTELTRHMDPLKLYEYVAAGKLTVASDVAFEQPPELVRRATDAEDFACGLQAALDGSWRVDADVRRRHLEASTWAARVSEILRRIRDVETAGDTKAASA